MSIDAATATPAQQFKLIDAQRAALLGALSSTIAHEFNNLMTPVIALAEEALSNGDDAAAARRALEVAVRQTEKAVHMSRQLLELAADRARRTEICSLSHSVEQAVGACVRPFSKDGIVLELDIDPSVRVRARPQLLEQVLVNLLFNAQRAMQDRGGTLRVAARNLKGEVEVSVSDSRGNVGVEWLRENVAPYLSNEFSERREGCDDLSLSLLACRAIAEIHGASISAEVGELNGCTFRLRWPKG